MTRAAIETFEDYQLALARLDELAGAHGALADLVDAYKEGRTAAAGRRAGACFDAARFLDSEAMIAGYLEQFAPDDPMAPQAHATAERARARLRRRQAIDRLAQGGDAAARVEARGPDAVQTRAASDRLADSLLTTGARPHQRVRRATRRQGKRPGRTGGAIARLYL